ncbi:protein RADIALIS-like 4 [Quercus robur]|uniref:protein RADIALIS-like 4 n=1 Tax=Quercus robur TaxID=38942 RepID=UPI002163855F|nr:protein RADIALIS-like 4 [Quercus robur]
MSGPSEWSWEENKVFENALAMHYEYFEKGEWEKIVVLIPTKTPTQISIHYAHLLEDIESIESGLVPPPRFQEKISDDKGGDIDLEEGEGSSTELE